MKTSARHRLRRHVPLAIAFVAFKAAYQFFPDDSDDTLPPGMESYIDPEIWTSETPIGGHYNWEGPDTFPYAGLAIFESEASAEVVTRLDRLLDDGDLDRGNFRNGTTGWPTFILEE